MPNWRREILSLAFFGAALTPAFAQSNAISPGCYLNASGVPKISVRTRILSVQGDVLGVKEYMEMVPQDFFGFREKQVNAQREIVTWNSGVVFSDQKYFYSEFIPLSYEQISRPKDRLPLASVVYEYVAEEVMNQTQEHRNEFPRGELGIALAFSEVRQEGAFEKVSIWRYKETKPFAAEYISEQGSSCFDEIEGDVWEVTTIWEIPNEADTETGVYISLRNEIINFWGHIVVSSVLRELDEKRGTVDRSVREEIVSVLIQ